MAEKDCKDINTHVEYKIVLFLKSLILLVITSSLLNYYLIDAQAQSCSSDAQCDDNNPCTEDRCRLDPNCICPIVGPCNCSSECTHSPTPFPFVSCDDGIACTIDDACSGGSCSGTPVNSLCSDGKVCTDDVCTAGVGCSNPNNTSSCNDGIACTTGDVCSNGLCTSGTLDNSLCSDGNVCTDDVCTAGVGCSNPDNNASCDDGTACTTGDTCSGGSCVGTALDCDDSNECTVDSCDSNAGCINDASAALNMPCGDPSDTDCDNPDTCDGAGNCQDNFEPSTTVCRTGSGDLCDPDETCSGLIPTCPNDIVADSNTVCRTGSADTCDPDETCTGVAGEACPADVVADATTVCREGSGDVCDPDETCTGVAGEACPGDVVADATTICREGSGDVCDPDEVCDGSDPECPQDIVEDNTFLCQLNPENFCPGIAGEECPVFSFASKIFPSDNPGCTHEAINLGAAKIVDIDITAICVGGGASEHTDANESCICIGPRTSGFNATGLRPDGTCLSNQTGPFCFVEGQLFWKEQLSDTCESVFVAEEGRETCEFDCPPGKMAISCFGDVRQVSNP